MDRPIHHIFFDLDGTLIDTAPSLVASLNRLLESYRLEPAEPSKIKPHISGGIKAILNAGFESNFLNDHDTESLARRYLEIYQDICCADIKLFDGIEAALARIKQSGMGWSVVTNKKFSLARRIIDHLRLEPSMLLGGDSLNSCKPHPDQLIFISRQIKTDPRNTVMVGDHLNDIEAACRCRSKSILARWGYLPEKEIWESWGADYTARVPEDLFTHLPLP